MNDNPYAAPLTPEVSSTPTQAVAIEGDDILVFSGAVLPPFCVKTGVPVDRQDYKRKTLYWCTPWIFALFFIGGFFVILAYIALRKKCVLTYFISPAVRKRYRRRIWLKVAIALALFVAIPFAATIKSPVPVIVATIAFIVSIIAVAVGNAAVSVRSFQQGRFVLKGCSPEFLQRVDEYYSAPAPTSPV